MLLFCVFGCRLRLQAESKGFRLDDTGLFPATQGSGSKRVFFIFFNYEKEYKDCILICLILQGTKGTANLKLYTEREVFDFLGVPWLEPHERNL
jgi:DNA polymerase lambda